MLFKLHSIERNNVVALLTCSNLNLGYDGTIVAEQLEFVVNSGDYLCNSIYESGKEEKTV